MAFAVDQLHCSFFISLMMIFGCCSSMKLTVHADLISDIHKHFLTSSVFLVHQSGDGLAESQEARDFVRLFTTKGIFAIGTDLGSLADSVKFYSTRIPRPLVVVLFKSDAHVAAFSEFAQNFYMAYPIWLLIFDNVEPRKRMRMLDENLFHLTFDTQLLVFRTESKNIEEWYSIRNETRRSDFAAWESRSGLVLRSSKSLYQRRTNLEGSTIVIALSHMRSMETIQSHEATAFFANMIVELCVFLNLEFQFVEVAKNLTTFGDSQQMWHDNLTRMLESGEADVTPELLMTSSMRSMVDFTHAFFVTPNKLFIRQPDDEIHWLGYVQVFSPQIWRLIGMMILVSAVLLTIASTTRSDLDPRQSFIEHLLLILGIFCQQGLTEVPRFLSIRLAYLSTFFSAIVILAAGSASLTSLLAAKNSKMPFTSLEGFLADGSYKLLVFPRSPNYDKIATSKNPTLVKISSLLKPLNELPKTSEEALRQICEERVAFFHQETWFEGVKSDAPCELVGINTNLEERIALAMSKKHPFYGIINYYIKHARYHGIFNRIKQSYFVRPKSPTSNFCEVTIFAVAPIFINISMGVALSILLLLLELVFVTKCRARTKKSKSLMIPIKIHPNPNLIE